MSEKPRYIIGKYVDVPPLLLMAIFDTRYDSMLAYLSAPLDQIQLIVDELNHLDKLVDAAFDRREDA